MDRFIECLCNDNLSVLIKSGTASKEQLQSTWLIILNEYHELKGNDIQTNVHIEIIKQLTRISNHLSILQKCIDFLWDRYSDSIAQSVRDLGYDFDPSIKNPILYRPFLFDVAAHAKTYLIEMEQLNIKLKEITPDPDEKITPEVFDSMLSAFESMQKVAYNFESITVAKFISLDRKYKAMIDALEAKKLKNGY